MILIMQKLFHIIGQVQNIAGISKDETTRILKYNTKDLNDAEFDVIQTNLIP